MRRNRFSQRFPVANTISQFATEGTHVPPHVQISAPTNVAAAETGDVSPEKTIRLPSYQNGSKRFTVRERGMRHF